MIILKCQVLISIIKKCIRIKTLKRRGMFNINQLFLKLLSNI